MAITKIQTGGIPALAVTHDKLHTTMDLSGKTVTLPTLTALDVTNNIVVGGTVDGIDIAARDAVLTSTTTTATAALPKAGGTMTGLLSIQADANARSIRIIGRSDDYGEMDFYENDNSTILARIQAHNTMFNIRAYSVPMNFQQGGNTKMTLLANGNVGIGTTDPESQLHVHGVGTLLSSDSYFVAQIQTDRNDDGSNDDGILQFVNGSAKTVKGEIRWDESTNTFELGHGDNQGHLVITSGGNVGIGGVPTSVYGLEIQKSNAGAGLYLHNKDVPSMGGAGIYHAYQITQTNGQSARLAEITALGASGWGGELLFSTKPANGAPNNTTAVAMKINSAGRVTMPYQPGFHVSNSTTPSGSSFSAGQDTLLKFNVINSNVGGGWNSSTYRYTAPISARYMIYGQARFDGLTSYSRLYVSINGAGSGWWSPGLHNISPSGTFNLWSHSVMGVLSLSAGDYIELKGGGNNSVGTHQGEGSFGAYLVG